MTRFLHIADTHLDYQKYGIRALEDDGYQNLDATMRWAIDAEIDVIIVAGDFFHSKDIRARAWLKVQEILGRARDAVIDVVMIEGNHDRALFGSDQTWCEVLEANGLATVLGTDGAPGWVDFNGIRVIGIPYLGHNEEDGLRDVYDACDGLSKKPTILLCHIGVSEAMGDLLPAMSADQLEALLHPHICYVATGHFHRPWASGIIYCPGTINPCSVSEPYGGWYVFDADKSGVHDLQYVQVEDVRDVRPIIQASAQDLQSVVDMSKEWGGAIVSLKYNGVESQDMLGAALQADPVKLIVTYDIRRDGDDRAHYQASSTEELEVILLGEILDGPDVETAVQLMGYVTDGQEPGVMVSLVKEKVGIQ